MPHFSFSTDLKFGQKFCFDEISDEFELSLPGSKTRSLGQIKGIFFEHSRGHISCSIDLKFGQNVYLDKIKDDFKFGSPGVKK